MLLIHLTQLQTVGELVDLLDDRGILGNQLVSACHSLHPIYKYINIYIYIYIYIYIDR